MEDNKDKKNFNDADRQSVDREKIAERLTDIEMMLEKMEKYERMTLKEFLSKDDNFSLASYWIRIGIEAVLTIGTHILSRIPSNGKKKDYTQVILSLGEHKIIPESFAQQIKGMAGYRNRLVHLYWKIEPEEILKIIQEEMSDFKEFLVYIKEFIQDKTE